MLSLLFLAATPAAALPTAAPAAVPTNFEFTPVTFGAQHPILLTIIQALFILTSLVLIVLMSMQTTKNEGLSGSIGGRSESAYRGRLGLDQQLTRLTGGIASAYVVLAVAYFLVTR
jgi:preprotein translocase subunit SecG